MAVKFGQNCPTCGRQLRSYENPPRLACPAHGVIPGEKVLRPDANVDEGRNRRRYGQRKRGKDKK